MTTVVIPQNIGKTKELVAVPRDIYEEFLEWRKITKSIKVVHPTAAEKRAIKQGREAIKRGDYSEWGQVKKELGL